MNALQLFTSKKPSAINNEDLFGYVGDTFWLLDGATTSDGPELERDAYWLVNELDKLFRRMAPLGLPLDVMASKACNELNARWPGLSEKRPVAALALWRTSGEKLDAAIAGNVSLIVLQDAEATEMSDGRVFVDSAAATLPLFEALARGVSFESAEFALLRRQMKAKEAVSLDSKVPGWLVSPAPRAPENFISYSLPLKRPTTVLAATDGFMELRRYWGSPAPADFIKKLQLISLQESMRRLRELETRAESGRLFPRTKRHDDATVVLASYE